MPSIFKFNGPFQKAGGKFDLGMGFKYQSSLRSGSSDRAAILFLSFVNTLCFPEVSVDSLCTLYTFPWNFGCKKSRRILFLVDDRGAAICLLLGGCIQYWDMYFVSDLR